MRIPGHTMTLVAALAFAGCEDFDVVDKSKSVVITKAEYDQLRAAALEAKQVGRYQLHRDGPRTWRLDTATGKSCLLLASQSDWDGEAKNQTSCTSEDYLERQRLHQLFPSLYDTFGNPITQPQPAKTN
jgi:hypothetical protein